jgi:hypothetical protein
MWQHALVFSCSLAFLVASCKTSAPSVHAAQVVDGGAPAVPDAQGEDGADGAHGDGAPAAIDAHRPEGADRPDGAPGAIICRTRDDCGCTRHYTPTRARPTRSLGSGRRDETPGDCIIGCHDGRCTAAQGPM